MITFTSTHFLDFNFVDQPNEYVFFSTTYDDAVNFDAYNLFKFINALPIELKGYSVENFLTHTYFDEVKLPMTKEELAELFGSGGDQTALYFADNQIIINSYYEDNIVFLAIHQVKLSEFQDAIYAAGFNKISVFLERKVDFFSKNDKKRLLQLYGPEPREYFKDEEKVAKKVKRKEFLYPYRLMDTLSVMKKVGVILLAIVLAILILAVFESQFGEISETLGFVMTLILAFSFIYVELLVIGKWRKHS